jgi:hypothetical protein
MHMGLLDAEEYDPRPAKRRRQAAAIVALTALVVFVGWLWLRYWPEKHAVDRFFRAIEAGDLDQAYALYTADANWRQHAGDHQAYNLDRFRLDWGPSGEYGTIRDHHVECVTEPPKKSSGPASGVIVVVAINQLSQRRSLWVEKNSKSITISPLECTPDCRQCQY